MTVERVFHILEEIKGPKKKKKKNPPRERTPWWPRCNAAPPSSPQRFFFCFFFNFRDLKSGLLPLGALRGCPGCHMLVSPAPATSAPLRLPGKRRVGWHVLARRAKRPGNKPSPFSPIFPTKPPRKSMGPPGRRGPFSTCPPPKKK